VLGAVSCGDAPDDDNDVTMMNTTKTTTKKTKTSKKAPKKKATPSTGQKAEPPTSVAARRRPRGAPVVARVLQVTIEQLARVGFANLSVPDVAMAAGVHKTSVYRRWPTKADLVRAALSTSMGHGAPPPDTRDLRSDMVLVARGALAFVESPAGRGALRTLLADGAHPEVHGLAASILAAGQSDAPQALLQRAIARGELPAEIDVALILRTIAGAILHRSLLEQAKVTTVFLEQLVDLVLDGARAPRRRRR
jgi:AcrR family transcriptional regulator